MVSVINKLTAPIARRVRLMVTRAVVKLVSDSLGIQGVQVSLLADEVRDNVERFQEYGFTSHPVPGAEAIAVCVGGSRDHAVVIAVDDRRYRLKGLAQGEVALYDDLGKKLVFKRNGTIEITGNVLVVGNITATGKVYDANGAKSMDGMRTVYNSHTHGGGSTPNQGM